MDLYTVVTFYQREAHTKPVVHSYGPYTRNQALALSKRWRREYLNVEGTFSAHTTKVIPNNPSINPSLKGG